MPWMPRTHYDRSFRRANSARRHAEYDERRGRDPRITAFYSSRAWRALRKLKLADTPVCEKCGLAGAVDAHHRKPVKTHPELALEFANLMSLCRSCHQIVEAEVRSQSQVGTGNALEDQKASTKLEVPCRSLQSQVGTGDAQYQVGTGGGVEDQKGVGVRGGFSPANLTHTAPASERRVSAVQKTGGVPVGHQDTSPDAHGVHDHA